MHSCCRASVTYPIIICDLTYVAVAVQVLLTLLFLCCRYKRQLRDLRRCYHAAPTDLSDVAVVTHVAFTVLLTLTPMFSLHTISPINYVDFNFSKRGDG